MRIIGVAIRMTARTSTTIHYPRDYKPAPTPVNAKSEKTPATPITRPIGASGGSDRLAAASAARPAGRLRRAADAVRPPGRSLRCQGGAPALKFISGPWDVSGPGPPQRPPRRGPEDPSHVTAPAAPRDRPAPGAHLPRSAGRAGGRVAAGRRRRLPAQPAGVAVPPSEPAGIPAGHGQGQRRAP